MTIGSSSAPSSWRAALRVYLEPRVALILLLGFASGLPLLLVYGTLSAWLREVGVSLTVIGWFSLASSAYALKFLWAPLVDWVRLPWLARRFGMRRGWLLLAQAVVIVAMLVLGAGDPAADLAWTALWAVILAFASATQDIVIDAYRIEILEEKHQGGGVANYVNGYRIATLISGGGALIVADATSWFWAYAMVAGLMSIGMAATLLAPEPGNTKSPVSRENMPAAPPHIVAMMTRAIIAPFVNFMTRPHWLAILAFIAFYKYGDALLGVMANPFYIDIGFTKTEIGLVTKVYGVTMSILGGVLGGLVVVRWGTFRALMITGILQALSNLVFAAQAAVGPSVAMLTFTISAENLTGAMATIAFVTYISDITSREFTATQFALLTSLMAFARTIFSAGGGWLADHVDWVSYFLITSVAALPGLLLLLWLMTRPALPDLQDLPEPADAP